LPILPVPLRTPDPPVLIDRVAVFTTAYNCGGFSRRINDEEGVAGPWKDVDGQWVQTVRRGASADKQ
jgi:hypothetical protein